MNYQQTVNLIVWAALGAVTVLFYFVLRFMRIQNKVNRHLIGAVEALGKLVAPDRAHEIDELEVKHRHE